MNIQAINPAFKGVTRSNAETDKLDAFINMDDKQLRQIAYAKTLRNFDDKKSRKVTNALFYSAPVAAGLAYGILGDGKTRLFSKELTGLAGRIGTGLKAAGRYAAILGAVDLFAHASKKLIKKSDKAQNFTEKHPFLTLGALIGGALGVVSLISGKGFAKLGAIKTPAFLQKGTEKIAKFLNSNKQIGKMKNVVNRFAGKVPSALKEIGATVLDCAPATLLLGGFFHTLASSHNKNREFAKNYTELRDKQIEVTRERLNQLVAENDTLLSLSDEEVEFAGII